MTDCELKYLTKGGRGTVCSYEILRGQFYCMSNFGPLKGEFTKYLSFKFWCTQTSIITIPTDFIFEPQVKRYYRLPRTYTVCT